MVSPPNRSNYPNRSLWKPSPSSLPEHGQASYKTIYNTYATRPKGRSLFRIISSAVVVVQEVALTCFLFLRHRVILLSEGLPSPPHQNYHSYVELSSAAMVIALVLAVVSASSRQNRVTKAVTRIVDAALLAVILRFISSLLHSLTASYSSDTVTSLALFLFLIHVLLCDYAYANGRGGSGDTTTPASLPGRQRPPFLGGTFSLNAALSATTLLTSRSQSTLSCFVLLGLAIILFGLYPMTRNGVAQTYPAHKSPILWLITASLCVADVLLLIVLEELNQTTFLHRHASVMMFGAMVILLLVIIPAYKCFWIRPRKTVLRGPWDIPQRASMQLDYYH